MNAAPGKGGPRQVRRGKQNAMELQKLEGVVEHMIYENPETGYAVFEVDAQGVDIVVAGNVGSVDNGMSVVVYGHMTTHPTYGEQFRADTCEASLPQDTAATLSYLSSGALPYIGPSTAKKIVAKFGDDTLTVIAESPQQLCEIRGITPEKAEAISREFKRMYGVPGGRGLGGGLWTFGPECGGTVPQLRLQRGDHPSG